MALVHSTTPATATFLFTDIEGSTQLLKSHRDEYASILADHHEILRTEFAAHGGQEVDNQGDAFFVAFARARDAVLAAAEIQRALARHAWPGGATRPCAHGHPHGGGGAHGRPLRRAVRPPSSQDQRAGARRPGSRLTHYGRPPGRRERSSRSHSAEPRRVSPEGHRAPRSDLSARHRGSPHRLPGAQESGPSEPSRRRRVALAAATLLFLVAVGSALAWASRDEPPPEVLPNSLVRIDADTLEPTDVFPIGGGADRVIDSGGYLWVMHHVLRDSDSGGASQRGRSHDHPSRSIDRRGHRSSAAASLPAA